MLRKVTLIGRYFAGHHVTSLDVVHGRRRGSLLFGRRTLGAGADFIAAAAAAAATAAAAAAAAALRLLLQATGLLLHASLDLTAALSPGNAPDTYTVSKGMYNVSYTIC